MSMDSAPTGPGGRQHLGKEQAGILEHLRKHEGDEGI